MLVFFLLISLWIFFLHFSNGFDDFLGKTIIVFNKTGAGPGITLYSYKDLARMCTSAKIHSNFIEQRKIASMHKMFVLLK